MRILWVKAGGLVPLDTGGKIRSYHLLKELARRHEVTFFTFYAAHPNDQHDELEQIFHRVVRYPQPLPPQNSWRNYLRYARSWLSGRPYALGRYGGPQVAARLRELLASESYDVLVCDFVFAAGVISWDWPGPKIFFAHNVEALIWRRHFELARNPLWKALCWREYRAMARAERHYLARADHALAVSGVDRSYFSEFIDPAKISVIPTGVDVDYFRPAPGLETPHALVFTGSLDWMPNQDGVAWFARQILPRIRRRLPQVSLTVVGRQPTADLQALAARDSAIQLTGRVDDVRPFVHQAAVYVVPLRIGSGTRLKIFEAMAMGKAVVSTTIGAEGLEVSPGENILLADEPEEFADCIVGLLENPARRAALARAARRVVEENFSWASAAARLEGVLARVSGQSPEPQPAAAAARLEVAP